MSIKTFEVYQYQLKTTLSYPTQRIGIFLRLKDAEGKESIGEIAPLPGRSAETLEESLQELKKVRDKFIQKELSPVFFPPSLMFGLEMALHQFMHPLTQNIPFLLQYIFDNHHAHFPSSTSPIKVKLPSSTIQAIELCQNIIKTHQNAIRIDAGREWDLQQAIQFCSHFSPDNFVYIEDPVKDFSDLKRFHESTNFSFALDDHLLFQPMERILSLNGLSHIVLKPMIHGGIHVCQEIVNKAKEKNVSTTLSCTYETEIGLMHIVRMAHLLGITEPLGIDTKQFFTESLLPFNPRDQILYASYYNSMSIPWKKLQQLL